jgi:hypothetical protein
VDERAAGQSDELGALLADELGDGLGRVQRVEQSIGRAEPVEIGGQQSTDADDQDRGIFVAVGDVTAVEGAIHPLGGGLRGAHAV